jgi:hypothetical protein
MSNPEVGISFKLTNNRVTTDVALDASRVQISEMPTIRPQVYDSTQAGAAWQVLFMKRRCTDSRSQTHASSQRYETCETA